MKGVSESEKGNVAI